MAIGVDRVQVIKTECTELGGQDSHTGVYGSPTPIDPEVDAIESAGGYVQESGERDETVGYCRDNGNLQFFDQIHPNRVNLSTLFFSPEKVPGGIIYLVPDGYQYVIYNKATIEGTLQLNGKLVVI